MGLLEKILSRLEAVEETNAELAAKVERLSRKAEPLQPLATLAAEKYSADHIHKLARSGDIPGAVRVKRKWMIKKSDWERWEAGRVKYSKF